MFKAITDFLSHNITGAHSDKVIEIILIAGIALSAVVGYYVVKGILNVFERFVVQTPTHWDDDLINSRMIRALSQLAPALIINWMLPAFFRHQNHEISWISSITYIYIVWALCYIIIIFLDNLHDAFLVRENLKMYAVKGVFQMFKIITVAVCAIITISVIIGKTPFMILGALGASAAVLMLVFQDAILGLVASIQLTANKMLQRGDWIEDPNHDVNGEVLEITLSAVKVRNWDNSVSTVPPYVLMKGSFRNYNPMRESEARRVSRAIYIDVNTIRRMAEEEIAALHAEGKVEDKHLGSREVNLKLLRRYLEHYLTNHEHVVETTSPDHPGYAMTMVRQLAPTNAGLPLELYFFVDITDWKAYEAIVSDIFDDVYATVGEFGLRMFQTPAGTDISRRVGETSS